MDRTGHGIVILSRALSNKWELTAPDDDVTLYAAMSLSTDHVHRSKLKGIN